MNRLFILIFVYIFTFSFVQAQDFDYAADRKIEELGSFYEELDEQIALQEVKVATLLEQIQSKTTIPSYVVTLNLQTAISMLEVKKTLYANFYGTASLTYPAIRAKLLTIFKKDLITQVDLAELSYLVNLHKEANS